MVYSDFFSYKSGRLETFLTFGLAGVLMSSSTLRLYRGRVPRLTSDNFRFHTRDTAGRP